MYYAPVLIPTLNRYVHFKRCLESLEKCTNANKTEVYIALDFPPSKKYEEGWKLIGNYLIEKEKNNNFKSLKVVRRNQNFGICHENGNYETLIREISKKYESYILTEDDNEFSPNFLEFINKGLELYRDKEEIMLISGYAYPDINKLKLQGNVFAFHKAAAWGCAYWTAKKFSYEKIGAVNYRDQILQSWKKSLRLFFKRPISLNSLMSMRFRKAVYIDGLMVICLLMENKYCIFPKISKVRNWGQDGSGASGDFLTDDFYSNQEIDVDEKFEYENLVYSSYMPFESHSKSWVLNILRKLLYPIIIIIRYIFFRMVGKDLFWFRFNGLKCI